MTPGGEFECKVSKFSSQTEFIRFYQEEVSLMSDTVHQFLALQNHEDNIEQTQDTLHDVVTKNGSQYP